MNTNKTAYLTIERKKLPFKIETKVNFFPYHYYLDKKGVKHLKDNKRIAILLVPNNECTNRCLFCEPNIPILEKIIGNKLTLYKEPSINQIIKEVKIIYNKNKDTTEIVIGGGIGEPLLRFNKLLKLILKLKKEISIPIRINTNGQASAILSKYSNAEICKFLEKAGLDSIMISLNAVTKKDYNTLCKPKLQTAFKSTVNFIKACNKSNIKTYISFIDYPKSLGYPKLNKTKIKTFLTKLGLNKNQIIYRPIIMKK